MSTSKKKKKKKKKRKKKEKKRKKKFELFDRSPTESFNPETDPRVLRALPAHFQRPLEQLRGPEMDEEVRVEVRPLQPRRQLLRRPAGAAAFLYGPPPSQAAAPPLRFLVMKILCLRLGRFASRHSVLLCNAAQPNSFPRGNPKPAEQLAEQPAAGAATS